eukprot:NODE_5011_length_731_cov_15.300587_g4653_i0.p1 GENE.NODE_5011_length_731_cov_15.300587_g4653_i0~~NODE_5011_length_731_cov_15.300587_g4653_i0.p1  ORF type:complete len:223 (-),score=48.50 NODE_5011_length_731_cov_15.300587_g4653_i0:3-671(-)
MDAIANVHRSANKTLADLDPSYTMLATIVGTLVAQRLLKFLRGGTVQEDVKTLVFLALRKVPQIRRLIASEMSKATESNLKMFARTFEGTVRDRLPEDGLSIEQTKLAVDEIYALNGEYSQGQCSGAVYNDDHELTEMLMYVHKKFHWSNPLHFEVFAGIKKMESEVVAMGVSMFNGDAKCCGSMTSGGTESILMALKAYRDSARVNKRIYDPNIILPCTLR